LADLLIVLAYFILIFVVAVRGRQTGRSYFWRIFLEFKKLKMVFHCFLNHREIFRVISFGWWVSVPVQFGSGSFKVTLDTESWWRHLFCSHVFARTVVTITFYKQTIGNRVGLVYSLYCFLPLRWG
jgi:hypothetical protein